MIVFNEHGQVWQGIPQFNTCNASGEQKVWQRNSVALFLVKLRWVFQHFCPEPYIFMCFTMGSLQGHCSLKTLTSLNKEVRPLFLSDNSIWSFPSFSSLSDYSIWRSWRLSFSLAITAFGAFGFVVPIYYYRLGKMDKRGLDSLI